MSSDYSDPIRIYPVVGIIVAICGNILISVALNIQRYAHVRLDRIKKSPPSSSTSSSFIGDGIWWLGIVIMTVGETGNFLAYGIAPPSVVSPLGVFALVSNCIIAPVFFNEEFKKRDLIGVGTSIVGILLVIFSVQQGEDGVVNDPLDDIHEALGQLSFRVYGLVTIGLLVILVVLLRDSEGTEGEADGEGEGEGVGVGVRDVDGGVDGYGDGDNIVENYHDTSIIDESPLQSQPSSSSFSLSLSHQTSSFTLFGNIACVALLGAYTALSTKCLSSLLRYNFTRALTLKTTYLLAFVVISTATLQVLFLNRALKHFPSTLVIPVHFVFFTISVIIGSELVFHDFDDDYDFTHSLMFIIGCILTFIGVWFIAAGTGESIPNRRRIEGAEVSTDTTPLLERCKRDLRSHSDVHSSLPLHSHTHRQSRLRSHSHSHPYSHSHHNQSNLSHSWNISHDSIPFALTAPGVYIGQILHSKKSTPALYDGINNTPPDND